MHCPKHFEGHVPRAGLSQAFWRACPKSGLVPSILKGMSREQACPKHFKVFVMFIFTIIFIMIFIHRCFVQHAFWRKDANGCPWTWALVTTQPPGHYHACVMIWQVVLEPRYGMMSIIVWIEKDRNSTAFGQGLQWWKGSTRGPAVRQMPWLLPRRQDMRGWTGVPLEVPRRLENLFCAYIIYYNNILCISYIYILLNIFYKYIYI